MSTDEHYAPLLSSNGYNRQQQNRKCPFSYRFQFIHSKGALLVLFWDIMIAISGRIIYFIISDFIFSIPDDVYVYMFWGLLDLLAGIIGDTCVIRYHMIINGSYVMFTCMILISLFLLVLNHYSVMYYFVCGFYLILMIAYSSVRVNLLPFNIDQLIGSSSDELSAVIHWHTFGPFIGLFIVTIINIKLKPLAVKVTCLFISVLCVTAVLVSHSLFKHWLDITPQTTTNPFKLIVRVLHYARKHKYPENRSALTYWEEEAPSRLDLGMEKYGGPFAEEEVEDVKTVFQLLPLFICLMAQSFDLIIAKGVWKSHGCSFYWEVLSVIGMFTFLVFLYQFLIFPCFYNYIPSMLKRIGMGLVLAFIVIVYYTVLTLIKYLSGDLDSCILVLNEVNSTAFYKWQIVPGILEGFSYYFFYISFIEFVLAQSPKGLRGTFTGLWFCLCNWYFVFDAILFLPFHYFMSSSVPIGRSFYYFLTKSILSFLLLSLFVYLAKLYKYRVRENEVPIHRIVEDHHIRYMDQEEEYMRNESGEYSDIIIESF